MLRVVRTDHGVARVEWFEQAMRTARPNSYRRAMTDVQTTSSRIDELSVALNETFNRLQADDDVFAPDAFFDLLPPFWRFQLQGPETFAAQLAAIAGPEHRARILRVVPTATGFVLEHQEEHRGDTVEVARRLFLCTVEDDVITEVVCYCNGGWDDALRERHAAEAPMLRPDPEPLR
jgi:hypothetical protein